MRIILIFKIQAINLSPNAKKPPEGKFKKIPGFKPLPSSPMPASYIRHIEKSQEDLDQEVEYDMDDEVLKTARMNLFLCVV